MTRIKTLAELSEQYDRISDYLTQRGRYGAACKVDAIYKRMFNRIFELIGITEFDDDAIELAYNEPLLVSEYQRLL